MGIGEDGMDVVTGGGKVGVEGRLGSGAAG
jgi:hypothetical protein